MDNDGTKLDQTADDHLQRLSEVTNILKRIGKKTRQNAEDRDLVERLAGEIETISKDFSRWQQERRGERETGDAERALHDVRHRDGNVVTQIKTLHRMRTKDPEVVGLQETLDDLHIMRHAIGLEETLDSDYLREKAERFPILAKALQTGGTTEPNWMPV